MERPNRLKVAAIQMEAIPYEVDDNLRKAERLIEQAAQKGARIVVLPELFNTGYCYDDRNFQVGEDLSGPTVRWMRHLGKRLNLYIAGGVIERERRRYYDTLVFTSPHGRLASYRKRWLALQEKCYFTRGDHPLLVETPVGRIGIGICADMFDRKAWERFRNKANLIIISSAWPDLTTGGFLFSNTSANLQVSRMPQLLPQRLASSVGAPVVYANLCGPFNSPLPLLYPYHISGRFVGHSAVYERDGTAVATLKDKEGMALAEVVAEPIQAQGKYRIERGALALARLDRILLTAPCGVYKLFKRPTGIQ